MKYTVVELTVDNRLSSSVVVGVDLLVKINTVQQLAPVVIDITVAEIWRQKSQRVDGNVYRVYRVYTI